MPKFITHDDEGVVIEQGSQSWKQLRVGLFTGTSMIDLMPGKKGGYTDAREKAIYEVVAEIITGKPVVGFKASKYMKEGIEKEPFARMAYQVRTDTFVQEIAFIRHDWLRCGASPDGLIPEIRRGVELKSPKETTHLQYLLNPELLVEQYRDQVLMNIWMSGYDGWDLCSFHPDFEGDHQLLVVSIERDEAYIKRLETEVTKAHAEVNLLLKKFKALSQREKEIA